MSDQDRRDRQGRFAKGNPGGPGNPHAARVGAWRRALVDAVTDDDLRAVVGALVARAREGEKWAVKELLDRTLGRPTPVPVSDEGEPGGLTIVLEEAHRPVRASRGREGEML